MPEFDPATCGCAPEFAEDPTAAHQLLQRDGAVIVPSPGTTESDARQIVGGFFGEHLRALPPAARVFEGGEMDRRPDDLDHTTRLAAHTDGYGYGDLYPDYFALNCVNASPIGGESFLVDGYALLDAMRKDEENAWVPSAMEQTVINQSEPGMQTAISPIVQRTNSGRLMLKKTRDQRPADTSADPERDREMIRRWHAAAEQVAVNAPKFTLTPGQAVIVDNYRMLHGRWPYSDLSRLLWRVWAWTDQALGVPDLPLHSDTRFAGAT